MAENNNLIEQMLEHLVNDEQEKAEELFHEYVVSKSREIYEGLIESEISEGEDEEDEEDDEEMEEAASDEDAEEDQVDEEFEDIAIEGDDEMDLDAEDPTDDLADKLGDGDEDTDMSEKEPEELFQDLDAIVDELQSKFDAMNGGESGEGDEGDEEMKDDFELETVREYVENVPAGHGAEKKGASEKADNTKALVDNMKNDMGGTSANLLKGGEEKGRTAPKVSDLKSGNINVPGGKAGKTGFTHKEKGHGAEKKGATESSTDGQSLFRGRR